MLRVGIIGCGLIGRKRAGVIKSDPGCYLSCVADVKVFNAATLIKEFGNGKAYHDWREMLDAEKLDIVVAATPNKFLKEIVLWAAQRNIHVLCEKPLGRNAEESEAMVAAARENGVVLKAGFNHRYHPAIWKAHYLVGERTIGDVYFIRCIYGHGGRSGYEKEWRASRDICGGGELLDQGVHVVDLFRWFMGDFEEAFGYTPTYYWEMDVEDNAFACFKNSEGKMATMHTSWTQWKNRFIFEIFGEAGYLIIDGLGGSYGVEKLTVGLRRKELGANSKVLGVRRGETGVKYTAGVPDEEAIVFDGLDISWEEEWKEFTSAIREGREPLGSGKDGLEANRMIAAVYQSAAESRPVKMSEVQDVRR
ncbi:MAG: Gfo/Idh/MocA family oxidoreductase [Deltaproteobacteria bacterium]|nr:Gfo/Idh/MocA family oxidoreductase [Deltaproteobacteria bacterium]